MPPNGRRSCDHPRAQRALAPGRALIAMLASSRVHGPTRNVSERGPLTDARLGGRDMADSTIAEEWRPIKGWEGRYEVSDFGRVKSLRCKGHQRVRPVVLAPGSNGRYLIVNLAHRRMAYVHRLVLEAFLGPCPSGMNASHLDGDRLNNRAENLAWESHSDNCARKQLHGTHQAGAASPRAKLCWAEVESIRDLAGAGVSTASLALKYSVSRGTISRVVSARAWRTPAMQANGSKR